MNEDVNDLTEVLKVEANAVNAISMSKYMKGKFEFFGIKSPRRKEIQQLWFETLPIKSADFDHATIAKELWNKPQREFQYIAQELLQKRKKFLHKEDITLIEDLLTTKSWWDTVDHLSSNILADYLKKFPLETSTIIKRFSESNNLWLERATLIFQLKYKEKTDFELIKSLISYYNTKRAEREIRDNDKSDFFIQKAIGWSLRQYSKHNPIAVQQFIETNTLSSLAKREGSKYL